MIDRIYRYMTRYDMAGGGGHILVAVSGGADSMCLLEALRILQERAGLKLRVLHVHHGLRESADGDLAYVAKYCEAARIPFEAVYVDAAGYAAAGGLSVEEAARQLRYEELEKAARKWEDELLSDGLGQGRPERSFCHIAVAHHMEDQAETVLFNLVRGSRLTGLRGMLPVNGRIIRPLLECSRGEIEGFLTERGISWREDETNEDVQYSRNLLRRKVMPLLEQINAGAGEHIARAAEEAAETEAFLREETERAIADCCVKEEHCDVISIEKLIQEPPLIRRRVVYAVIAETAGRKKDLQDAHVQAVLRLAEKSGNGRLDVFAGVRVDKTYDRLVFSRDAEPLQGAALSDRRWPMNAGEYSCRVFDFDGDLSAVSRKQYTKWLDYDKIGALPSFRTRREGDRITLDQSGRSKTVARYMIDAKIPAELRGRIVLPADGDQILWIPAGRPEASEDGADFPAGRPEAPEDGADFPAGRPEAPETGAERSSDGGRINAAYMVSGQTSRILEIRWEPRGDRELRGRSI